MDGSSADIADNLFLNLGGLGVSRLSRKPRLQVPCLGEIPTTFDQTQMGVLCTQPIAFRVKRLRVTPG